MDEVREINITPEMIEAGKQVLAGSHLDSLDPAELAELIYSVMRPLETAPTAAPDAKTAHLD